MTALDEYDRLEAVGILKCSEDDAGTEVVVTFGEATLTMNSLSNEGDRPITHWSLAAIDLVRETDEIAVYRLGDQTDETLETSDDTLRAALARVRTERVAEAKPKPRNRRLQTAVGVLALGAIGYLLLPGFVSNTASNMISPKRAEVLARDMHNMIEARTGPACENPAGVTALAKLSDRLNPGAETVFSIHDLGDVEYISLPAGRVLLNQQLLSEQVSNAVITAWAAAGVSRSIESPALSSLFEEGGFGDSLRFLSSGELPETAKARAVNSMMLGNTSLADAEIENTVQILNNAGLDVSNLNRLLEGQSDQKLEASASALLSDEEWTNLRNVCGS